MSVADLRSETRPWPTYDIIVPDEVLEAQGTGEADLEFEGFGSNDFEQRQRELGLLFFCLEQGFRCKSFIDRVSNGINDIVGEGVTRKDEGRRGTRQRG